jgi:hypothetical protein
MIIHPTNLFTTLDTTAEILFHKEPLSNTQRQGIANLITNRQCLTGVNAGLFIPFASESEAKVRLFSGESLNTDLARTHILMIEAVRILKLLSIKNHVITQSISVADHRMEKMCYSNFCAKGECRALTVAYMRYQSLDGIGNTAARINTHLTNLSHHRDGKGKWGSFPFFYTLLMLSELEDPLAFQELQYAAPVCKKQLGQNWPNDSISIRRQEIMTTALARS